ncbi:MAG: polysaccharide deacetylase family protein [Bacteroidetes bacterium]|nr:polysaccharide deacetylase family protein [Bacteroidota bacterium]
MLTNDVETTSILNHRLSDKTGEYVLKQGMPRLLDLYAKYNVRATFFFTGHIAKLYPEIVRLVQPYKHEIGSHGLTHEVSHAFDVLPLKTQIEHLKKSKAILEDICGEKVISFRAPAARVNNNIVSALVESGFLIDSSVASQRLDMFLSFGSLKKLNWLTTPRKPYFCHSENVFRRGDSSILEIPISAFGFPYIGTFMRIAPTLNRLTRNLLYLETMVTGRHFNFLTHPNEFIDEEKEAGPIKMRGSNFMSSFLGDVIRHKLKVKNLGNVAIPLLERELQFFKDKSFDFVTCQDVYLRKIQVCSQHNL